VELRRVVVVVALGVMVVSNLGRAEAVAGRAAGIGRPVGEQPAAPLVVNGSSAPISAHPHYAQIFATVDGQGTFFCGGSVVAPTIVLTAAHCVDGVDHIWVVTGSDELGRGSAVRALRWVTPGYRPATSQNDIALLHLARRVSARPIAIVGPGSDHRWLGTGHTFEVAGMGCTFAMQSTCNAGGGPSEILMHATIPSRSDAECNSDLAIWGGIDRRSMLCAGIVSDPFGSHNAPNACFGDSGGPLTVDGPAGVPLLVGAVSWGASTCGDYPVAYARLASFRPWLRAQGVPIERDAFDAGPPIDIDWDLEPIPGDFNGDGRTDVLWFEPGAPTHRLRVASRTGAFLSRPASR
jgi:secreted trypsin-like serine protease